MADDFDPLMNPEPERQARVASDAAPAAARVHVPIDAPAPTFAPPRPPPAKSVFDSLDDEDDGVALPAPAPSPAKPAAAPGRSRLFADDDDDDPLSSAPAAPPKPKVAVAAAAKTVDAASSNASQFTGVSKRGSTLFQDSDADALSGGASDVFIPSEARGLKTGIDSSISVEALDDSLLRVDDDDIDALFADQPAVSAPARKDRLGLSAPEPSVVGNRNASVSSLFGPKTKVSASSAGTAPNDDDDDDLFGDIGSKSSADSALGAMSELNFQEYIAKQKSRWRPCHPCSRSQPLTPPLQQLLRRPIRLILSFVSDVALSLPFQRHEQPCKQFRSSCARAAVGCYAAACCVAASMMCKENRLIYAPLRATVASQCT